MDTIHNQAASRIGNVKLEAVKSMKYLRVIINNILKTLVR